MNTGVIGIGDVVSRSVTTKGQITMSGSSRRDHQHGMSRRVFVGTTSVAGASLAVAASSNAQTPSPVASPGASPVAAGDGPLRYAVIGDSHVIPSDPEHAEYTGRIFAYLESLDPVPAFVIHVGDLVECGFEEEYEQYDSLIPDAFRDRIHHVPGNHEVRWDEHGNRKFVERYGQAPFSFDEAGVHFVALDPTTLLQELGQFGEEQLAWLTDDLEQVGTGTPTILFFHYPVGGENYFITDQDALFTTIAPYNVIGIHAGHIHEETVVAVNGFVQATMRAAKDGPFVHLVDKRDDALELSAVELGESDEVITELAATISLRKDERFAFVDAGLEFEMPESGSVGTVSLPAELVPGATKVEVRLWPNHIYAGSDGDQEGWIDLEPDDEQLPTVWSDSLLAPYIPDVVTGNDRLEVKASDADGPFWQRAYPLTIVAQGELAVAWEEEVGNGAVQAGLVTVPNAGRSLVVAATSGGDVVAYDVTTAGPTEVWRQGIGEPGGDVIGTPAVTSDGMVVVGRLSGAVSAYNGVDGSIVWEASFDAPVLGNLAFVDAGNVPTLLVPAEGMIHALDPADGTERWAAGTDKFIGGRPTADAGAVYGSFGDGTVRAFSLEDGSERWLQVIAERDNPYSLLIYSAWAHSTQLLPGSDQSPEKVLTSTVVSATAHDRATGEIAWELPGGYMYAAPLLLDDETLILVSEWGRVVSIDPHTARDHWEMELGFRALNASPLDYRGKLIVPGTGAQVAILDAATGMLVGDVQLGGTALVSTPVVVDDVLVAGGQDGKIRAVKLPLYD